MTLLSGENIVKRFEERTLFNGLSFSINKQDRIGLVGPNGIGKTTLFELMVERVKPDSGQIVKAKNCRIAYVEQEFDEIENLSLFEFVASARQEITKIRKEIDELERLLHSDDKHLGPYRFPIEDNLQNGNPNFLAVFSMPDDRDKAIVLEIDILLRIIASLIVAQTTKALGV